MTKNLVMVKLTIFLIFGHNSFMFAVVVIFIVFLVFGHIQQAKFIAVAFFFEISVKFTKRTFVIVSFQSRSQIMWLRKGNISCYPLHTWRAWTIPCGLRLKSKSLRICVKLMQLLYHIACFTVGYIKHIRYSDGQMCSVSKFRFQAPTVFIVA